MKYRPFSDLGWNISEVGLGCWQIGWCWGDVSETDSRDILKEAVNNGVNFFDTSDMYGDGRSEKLIGDMIKSTKEKIYVTTKLGRRTRGTNYNKGFKEEHMEEFIDRSLKNLGIECIDLVQLHCPPLDIIANEETHKNMDDLIKKGKIANYGVSVHNISDAMEAIKFRNIKSIQIVFNIFRQRPAELLFEEAKKKKVAIIARGPLASGLLTGDINMNTKFAENDHRNYNINGEYFDVGDTFSGVKFEKGLEAVNELKKILPEEYTLADLALKWILMHDAVSVVIPGAINKTQVIKNIKSSELPNISSLLEKISLIYEDLIKPDVHHRW
jgi:aryl-alcohol dehydrogenase-like predicted oxidoreductase|tara:strand:+ start:7409 stop:8392 length:984 start_codon:yes stop_codon:yes gene_type:complete